MNYGFVVTAKFDRKFSQILQKFHNLWQNGCKLKFYGIGPSCLKHTYVQYMAIDNNIKLSYHHKELPNFYQILNKP